MDRPDPKLQQSTSQGITEPAKRLAYAMRRVQVWTERASLARDQGRMTDAERCDAKVRDWQSKVDQLTRRVGEPAGK